MKVAILNTNTYLMPPVIPLGIEYLASPLEAHGHEVALCDLAFCEEPEREAVKFIEAEKPDVVGYSVRNMDMVIKKNNVFFLDGVRKIIEAGKQVTDATTVAGGSASLCAGEPLRAYLGIDHLIRGPAEGALPALLSAFEKKKEMPSVIDGWSYEIPPGISHKRGKHISYERYLEAGAPVGIESKKGCDRLCTFCVERRKPLMKRETKSFVSEARELAELGFDMLFLCDSEINLSGAHTKETLKALAGESLGICWTGYFSPFPFDEEMARLASLSGCSSVTLSVTSWELSQGYPYGKKEVRHFCEVLKAEGIRIAVDLLVGYPGESKSSIEKALLAIQKSAPDTVGICSSIRLYDDLPITKKVLNGAPPETVSGKIMGNSGLLEPVWFSGIDENWLKKKIAGESLFILEGESKLGTVNYERI
ncbi:MAG: cobalamin-dependent protein [Actinomycetota bacterium]|nr:cobalamin-dependent protein [Actinomycetota bacterium]